MGAAVRTPFACALSAYGGDTSAGPLIANRSLRVAPRGEVPADLLPRARFRRGLDGARPTAWIEDPATAALLPVWLDDDAAAAVKTLEPGRAPRGRIDPPLRAALHAASILVRPDFEATRRAAWRRSAAAAARAFRRRGYAVLPPLLPPPFVAALAGYARGLISAETPMGDPQCALRYAFHNDRMARFVHHQLVHAVAAVAGEPLKPSYVYLASYRPGAVLPRHRDRAQCEVSVSFLIDFTAGAPPWPLRLDTADGPVAVEQQPGDALLYRGCELPHWREALPAGCTSTSLFLHYVPVAFAGILL